MLVLDFVLVELFRKKAKLVSRDEDDPIFTMSCMFQFLYHDLILLENQIPWFVVECLFGKTQKHGEDTPLVKLAFQFFRTCSHPLKLLYMPDLGRRKTSISISLTCLIRNCLIVPLCHGKEKSRRQQLPSATSMQELGIKFKKVDADSMLKVKIVHGILEMPFPLIQETTETNFRNLISYRQCSPGYEPFVTAYAIILDNLINTPEDMDVLCQNGIIVDWLNPYVSTQFFSKLYLVDPDFPVDTLCHKIEALMQCFEFLA